MTKLYIGEEGGKPIAGIEGEVKAEPFKAVVEVRSYIDRVEHDGFYPNRVWYKVGLGTDNIMLNHYCYHAIDREKILGEMKQGNEVVFSYWL